MIELKKGLDSISDNEMLKVIVGGKNVAAELVPACHALGHQVESIDANNQSILLVQKQH